jgi:hypothetical protein
VARLIIEFFFGTDFHETTEIHDRDTICDVLDNAQVMGDKDIGKSELGPKLLEEVEYLGLNGHIQG